MKSLGSAIKIIRKNIRFVNRDLLEISDGKTNLLDSFTYACENNSKGVVLIFNGNVILGTRARKVRTKSFNAFASIDYPRIAIVQDHTIFFCYRKS